MRKSHRTSETILSKKAFAGLLLIPFCLSLGSCDSMRIKKIVSKPYYSLTEEGLGTPVKEQLEGVCWVMAASTSMESNYLVRYGKEISIDPYSLLYDVFDEEREEGYFPIVPEIMGDIGGDYTMVTGAATNGFINTDADGNETFWVVTDATTYIDPTTEEIKEALATNGAIAIDTVDKDSDFGTFDGFKTLNDPTSDLLDHAVCIVGWDDNFPIENYRIPAQENGAWIAQNSHSELFGNDGFYRIAYESHIEAYTSFSISDEYTAVDSLTEGIGSTIEIEGCDVNGITCANYYEGNDTISAVGTYLVNPGMKVEVEIFEGLFGKSLAKTDAEFEYAGYHTIDLPKEIDVNGYTVVITYYGPAPVEGPAWHEGAMHYDISIDEGQSFVYIDNEPRDLFFADTYNALGWEESTGNLYINVLYK